MKIYHRERTAFYFIESIIVINYDSMIVERDKSISRFWFGRDPIGHDVQSSCSVQGKSDFSVVLSLAACVLESDNERNDYNSIMNWEI
jgi:hypothetical protein